MARILPMGLKYFVACARAETPSEDLVWAKLTLLCLLMELSSPLSILRRHKLLMSTPPMTTVPTLELMATTPTPAVRVRFPTAWTLETLSDPLVSMGHDCLRFVSFEALVK